MAGMGPAGTVSGLRDARRCRRVWAALAAVVALAAASCAGGPASGPSSMGRSRFPTILTACVVGGQVARCRYVWVPQDWAHPRGPRMPLKIAVLPAGTAHPAADPVFYLAGVGGQSVGDGNALENGFTWASQAFSQLNRTRDLVFVEQRGTPGSGLQTCPGPSAVHNLAALRAWARHCLASARRDPRHDTTIAAARDLDQVREALGYTKINLYGPSYGVTLGLAYLQRYSAHVRTAVFDSGSLLNVRLEQLAEAHTQQVFGQVARDCAADPACGRSYHPAADLHTIVANLKAHPARVILPASTYSTSGQQAVTITVPLFLQIIADQYLASALTAVFLPADLRAMARGQWRQVIDERGYTTAVLPAPGPVSLQYLTIECGDTWAAVDPAKAGQQAGSLFAPIFTPAAAQAQQALCAAWPHDPGASGIVHSTVPAVFLNGTLDAYDPPANVATAPATMPHALLVSVPGAAHWVLNQTFNPGCLLAATTAFIQSGKPANPAPWARCTRALVHHPLAFPTP